MLCRRAANGEAAGVIDADSNKEWVPTKYVYQYTMPVVLIEFVLYLIVGIPLCNIMM